LPYSDERCPSFQRAEITIPRPSKLRPGISAPTRMHFHHVLSEDANSQKAIASKYRDVSTTISNCNLKQKAKPAPAKRNQYQKNKNNLKKIVSCIFLFRLKCLC